MVRNDLVVLLYKIGTQGYLDFGQIIFDNVVKHAAKQVLQKPVGFPSLIFGLIQSQVSVLQDTDEFEKQTSYFVITNKLRNTAYHVNNIPAPVMTDATTIHVEPQPVNDMGMLEFKRELVVREMELQSAYLGRMIKASQSRKSLLADINYIDAARSSAPPADESPTDQDAVGYSY